MDVRFASAVALGLALAACEPGPAPVAFVDVLDFHQTGERSVFLNEPLVLHFSGELDRSSVTRSSVSVFDGLGRPAAGRLSVSGAHVTFTPELPRSPGLRDGGFLPGREYQVAVTGFPFPDGVRGRDGEPLRRSYRFAFATVAFDGEPSEAVFAPPLVETPAYLAVDTQQISPVDPIVLSTPQPLDPRTVTPRSFQLLDGATSIPLRVALVRNEADGARIELRALGDASDTLRALDKTRYFLRLGTDEPPPHTLGGLPVHPLWLASKIGGVWIYVQGRAKELRIGFDKPVWTADDETSAAETDRMWSPQPVAGTDGTASWGDGEVTIRYPAAAGTGRDGAVALEELDADALRDLHATRIELATGATVELPPDGLVVLRSQGRMRLSGALRRARPSEDAPEMTFPNGDDLSSWLARARAEDPPWTVLIAGGDLVVDRAALDAGGVNLGGPLLLVAGGRLRVSDELRAEPARRLAPGVDTIPWAFDWDAKPDERFRVDEPLVNPLVEPLTFGVQSASYRPDTGVVAWRPARQGVWNGMGEVRIRWIGQRFTLNGPEEYGQLEDLVLLADRDAVRFSIELTLPAASDDTDQPGRAAGAWDPPKVDFVDLRWDAPLPGEAAPGAPGPSAER